MWQMIAALNLERLSGCGLSRGLPCTFRLAIEDQGVQHLGGGRESLKYSLLFITSTSRQDGEYLRGRGRARWQGEEEKGCRNLKWESQRQGLEGKDGWRQRLKRSRRCGMRRQCEDTTLCSSGQHPNCDLYLFPGTTHQRENHGP